MTGLSRRLSIAVGAGLTIVVDYRVLIGVVTCVNLACAAYLFTRSA